MGRLPVGYTELEYIESTGTQYIKSDLIPTWNSRISIDVQTVTWTGFSCIVGSRNKNSVTATLANLLAYSANTKVRSDYYGSSVSYDTDIFKRHKIVKDGPLVYLDGTKIIKNSESNRESTLPVAVMGMNNCGAYQYLFRGRLFSFQMQNALDGKSADYVPCKSPSGSIGVFDLISQNFFGNSGTGEFISGPEIKPTILPPENLRYRNIDRKIFLQWDPVSDATEYAVYKNDNLAAVVSDPQYDDPDEFNASFEYSVIARSPDGSSEPSKVFVYGIISPKLLQKNVFSGEPIRIDFQIFGIPFIFQFPFLNNSLTEKKIIFSKKE